MWSEVFLAQAKSDWRVYEHLRQTPLPEGHALHYLQMATEKLAKAYLLADLSESQSIRLTHRALTRFLKLCARIQGLQGEMGMTPGQFRAHIQQLLPLAFEIEKLAPDLALGGPNPEYPWEMPKGTFHVPADHKFAVSALLNDSHGHKLIKLVRTALEKFYVLHE